ncbi:ABC-F family ATP-binding cassette domain-containing protein, partial [Amycolatopsis sp. H6(2020)]|nr:ABC-F family ATP-binding cassette domain-containing protein [Amycolatopsis sp. H6(2020)]
MLTVSHLELRAGARLLMEDVSFRINRGDKIGLVGRNGAGKTTMTKVLAGQTLPADGEVTRSGSIGYLPQDPKVEDMTQSARDRIFSARNLAGVVSRMRRTQEEMASEDESVRAKALRRYDRLEAEFIAGGGYAAESEAATITHNLDLPERVLDQPLSTLSGGQRRRVELARILFQGADTMLLDEPTNHLDADSIEWLREFLRTYSGGLLV